MLVAALLTMAKRWGPMSIGRWMDRQSVTYTCNSRLPAAVTGLPWWLSSKEWRPKEKGRQRMRWLDSITNSMNLSKLGEMRSAGGGLGNPHQDSCLGNPMDRRAWRATVHRLAKSCLYMKLQHARIGRQWRGARRRQSMGLQRREHDLVTEQEL